MKIPAEFEKRQLTLHQESENDISTSVQLVIGLRVDTDRLGLESSGGSHGVFTSDTDTVEELGPTEISL